MTIQDTLRVLRTSLDPGCIMVTATCFAFALVYCGTFGKSGDYLVTNFETRNVKGKTGKDVEASLAAEDLDLETVKDKTHNSEFDSKRHKAVDIARKSNSFLQYLQTLDSLNETFKNSDHRGITFYLEAKNADQLVPSPCLDANDTLSSITS